MTPTLGGYIGSPLIPLLILGALALAAALIGVIATIVDRWL